MALWYSIWNPFKVYLTQLNAKRNKLQQIILSFTDVLEKISIMSDDEEITVESLTAAMALAVETELNIDTFHDAKWKIHRINFITLAPTSYVANIQTINRNWKGKIILR